MPALTRQSFKAYIPLVPWLILAVIFGMAWTGMHFFVLRPAEEHLFRTEADRNAVRQQIIRRQDAKETAQDMSRLLALLPTPRDFAQLPLTISEEANHKGVMLPSLSYTLEKSGQELATKATFKGPVTGRYEDLRRFIYGLETSSWLVFIEDLDVGRSGKSEKESQYRDVITVNLRMATYVRKNASPASPIPPSTGSSSQPTMIDDKHQGKEVRAQ